MRFPRPSCDPLRASSFAARPSRREKLVSCPGDSVSNVAHALVRAASTLCRCPVALRQVASRRPERVRTPEVSTRHARARAQQLRQQCGAGVAPAAGLPSRAQRHFGKQPAGLETRPTLVSDDRDRLGPLYRQVHSYTGTVQFTTAHSITIEEPHESASARSRLEMFMKSPHAHSFGPTFYGRVDHPRSDIRKSPPHCNADTTTTNRALLSGWNGYDRLQPVGFENAPVEPPAPNQSGWKTWITEKRN